MICVEIAAAAAAAAAVGAPVAELGAVVQNADGAPSENFVEAADSKMTEFVVAVAVAVDVAVVVDDVVFVADVADDGVVVVAAAALVAVTAAAMCTGEGRDVSVSLHYPVDR